jgi:hypothetical protein
MRDGRPTEPDESSGIPEECPVCKRDNADDEGELLFPSGHCSEFCEGHSENGVYALVDMEYARYIGNGRDGVYYATGQGPDGWYVSTLIDCETGSFCDKLWLDDGPYESEEAAAQGGKDGSIEWCTENRIDWAEIPWEDDKLQFARLIWELDAAGVPQETLDQMAESMDLDPAELQELFARAIKVFEDAKSKEEVKVLAP